MVRTISASYVLDDPDALRFVRHIMADGDNAMPESGLFYISERFAGIHLKLNSNFIATIVNPW